MMIQGKFFLYASSQKEPACCARVELGRPFPIVSIESKLVLVGVK